MEWLRSAMVADRMIAGSHRPNAELTAQGTANIGSALFAGLPATDVIARTATKVRAGAKTPAAGLVYAACWVDLTVAINVGVSAGLALRLSRRKSVESDWMTPDRERRYDGAFSPPPRSWRTLGPAAARLQEIGFGAYPAKGSASRASNRARAAVV